MGSSATLPNTTIKKGVLPGFRVQMRGALHQIISYAEIMLELIDKGEDKSASSILSLIITQCDLALQLTCHPELEPKFETFPEQWQLELLECSRSVLRFSEQLQELAPVKQNLHLQSHAMRLHDAGLIFVKAVQRIQNGPAGSAAPESQPGQHIEAVTARTSKLVVPEAQVRRSGVVLVVDDNESNREILSRRLLRDGCEVMLAETGKQALRMARRYEFDLVLLDIMMPEMDGFAVLRELKQDEQLRHLPVIMISAVDEIDSVVRCIELGAEDYLFKPFNPVLLRARINALLERKQMRDQEMRRTRELEQALAEADRQRKKAEELLLNILPASVAEELQANGHVEPMYFEDVTIVFADFVGFTLAVEQLPAEELVRILNEYFTDFDNIVGRYGLEKLKTIGDSYMFAGGLPVRNPAHPVDAVLAALEMIHVTKERTARGPVDWQLRIGLHTGPVVAGVVGIHKFAFDIWGDSVNFGSRMEASGAAGRINMSAFTYARVKDFFSCEKRGRVEIKDGREVEMYFVNGVSAGLLAKKDKGAVNLFEQRYRTYFRHDVRAFPEFLRDSAALS